MNKRSSEEEKRQGTRTTLGRKRGSSEGYLKEEGRDKKQRRGQRRQRSCGRL